MKPLCPRHFLKKHISRLPWISGRKWFSTSGDKMSTDSEEMSEETCRNDSMKLLPILSTKSHKGQAGRVGIIGGSAEYTGAPIFAGMSALRAGADLVYIFTVEKATPVIRGYSPDLIVLPYLEKPADSYKQFLARLHTLIIGPGLGRSDELQKSALNIIEELNKLKGTTGIPLIIDADGIQLLLKNVELFKCYSGKIYLTPNVNEFKILYTFLKGLLPIEDVIRSDHVEIVTQKLGSHFTVVVKGPTDLIVNGTTHVLCSEAGSKKRCGGQGDLLSGILGTTAYWAFINDFPVDEKHCIPEILAGYIACMIVRKSSSKTFKVLGRSMQASDILNQLPSVFSEVYGQRW